MKIAKQPDTTEFKEGAVKRVKGGQSVRMVYQALGLSAQTLLNGI
jgi:transposase-like protein